MRIPFTNIIIGKDATPNVQDVTKARPVTADPYTYQTDYRQAIYRQRQDLGTFKKAVIAAENYLYPYRYDLYQIYINIVLDSHLSAAIQQRKNLTMCKKFRVLGKDGEINEDKTAIIQSKWFRDFVSLSLDSIYWGHSLIQLGAIVDDNFTSVSLIPRQYVKQEFHLVVKNWGDDTGTNYLDPKYIDWVVPVGDDRDLGLLLKAAPLILWKNSALGAWAEYQDNFGSPLRYVQTNIKDDRARKNAENYMANWGVNPWAVFDKDDIIKLVETTKADAHNVFNMMIDRCNSELSKLILGQTSTLDEKSFTGSAEVHERVAQGYEEVDEHFINNVLNYQLMPLLIRQGIMSQGDVIECEDDYEIDVLDKAKMTVEFIKTGKYMMETETIKDEFGIDLVEVEQADTNIKNVLNEFYK